LALPARRNRDQKGAEDVGAAFVEAAGDRAVDARRQIVDAAVPANRDGPRARDELVALDEVELEVRQLLRQPRPVPVEDVAVVVVLGQSVARK
jgi:hypothetical protein